MQTHWINNQPVAGGGDPRAVINPATEEPIDDIPAGTAHDAQLAVQAASAAFPTWAALAPAQRRALLDRAATALDQRREEIAGCLTREMGKTLAQSRAEIAGAADVVRQLGVLALHLRSGAQMAAAGELNFQQRVARGVAAVIVPWNYPVLAGVENVAANLLVGNTVVWKPSEKTPMSSRLAAELAFGHLPPGVLNVLLGDGPGAGDPLVRHPLVEVVVFVGSERTGRHIGALCGHGVKKAILELGGKDALIVDETVDVPAAARFAAEAAFTNAGQICTSIERIYVARRSFGAFVDALVAASARLRLGEGTNPEVDMGPIVDGGQLDLIASQVQDAVSLGGELHHGGHRLPRSGFFYAPTVVTGMPPTCALMTEETFGPVAPCVPYDDFDEAIAQANASRFGLAAIVCTRSAPRALHAVHALRAGMVRINAMRGRAPGGSSEPFGASGIGHGYGLEFLQELTRQKSLHWRQALA